MKSLDIEIAVMEYLGTRTNLIVPNVSWGMDLHECDILSLSKAGYATGNGMVIMTKRLLSYFLQYRKNSN